MYREERKIKITAPGLNKDRATGTLALDAGTQLGEAQEQIRGLVEDRPAGTLARETANQLRAARDKFATETLQRSSQDQVELKFSIYSS